MGVRSSLLLTKLFGLALAVAGLAFASQVEIPMQPVPLTLQTLAVVLTGFLLGPRLGFTATAIWLVGGAAGLPFFAGGESGIRHLTGPTGGYLMSFPFAAALAGWGAEQGGKRFGILRLFLTAIVAHLLILAAGGLWLSTKIGVAAAIEKGVIPFLPGAVLKSVAAAILIEVIGANSFRHAKRVRAPATRRH